MDNIEKKMPTKETIIRTVLLVIAIVNNCLTLAGKPILPFENESVTNFISAAYTGVIAVLNWWYNASFTKQAIIADEQMHAAKEKAKLEKANSK